jgi:RNA polymerase sigma factor (TIGR02999 family)
MNNEPGTPPSDAAADLHAANERLFAALYAELHQLAERQLRSNAGVAVSATTLLHETYLGLVDRQAVFPDRSRFMGYAARVMRGLIIDFARQRRALKRGGEFHITQLDATLAEAAGAPSDEHELQRLSEALDELATRDARLAEIVDLKYFCGLSLAEIASLRGVSERTVRRDWEKARLVLYHELEVPASR